MTGASVSLVLGGARSGKSRHAESLVMVVPPPWLYLATAEPGDAEMAARIAEHRARRGVDWETLETPLDVPQALRAVPADAAVLVECLTLWTSNLMHAHRAIDTSIEALLSALGARTGPTVLVSNEVGSGIIPGNELARAFRDAQGEVNQRVAAYAAHVVLMVVGLPLTVK